MRSSSWPYPLLVAALLAVSGCGSTAPAATQPAAAAELGGLSVEGSDPAGGGVRAVPGGPEASGEGASTGLAGAAAGFGGPAPAAASTGVRTATGSTSAAAGKGQVPPVSGRGFTATTITIGYAYSSDLDTAYSTYNIQGESPGNTPAQMEALARWVNANGGIQGRSLRYVAYDISAAELAAGNQSQLAEEACTQWTLDNKVFAVVRPGVGTAELRACLAKRDTPLIGHGDGAALDEAEYRKYANHLYDPGQMSTQTLWPAWVKVLVGGRYFTGWDARRGAPADQPVKIGLLHPDNVDANRSAEVLKRALAAAGHPVDEEFAYQGSVQGSSTGNQAAVLQFKGKGVTHVINPNLLFLQAAANQDYRPRYSFSRSANVLAQNAPPGSLTGSLAVGSSPAQDVDARHDPGPPTEQARLCDRIMQETQEDTRSGRTILSNMRTECDAIFLLKAALERSELSTAGLRRGVEALGDALPSAQTWVSSWGPGRHASGRALRLLGYDDACSCFTYRGPVVTTG